MTGQADLWLCVGRYFEACREVEHALDEVRRAKARRADLKQAIRDTFPAGFVGVEDAALLTRLGVPSDLVGHLAGAKGWDALGRLLAATR